MWGKHLFRLNPKIPVGNQQIDDHVSGHWPTPGASPGLALFKMVLIFDDDDWQHASVDDWTLGKDDWEPATPFEIRVAPIRACARDFRMGYTSEQHKNEWSALFRRGSCQIRLTTKTCF